MDVDESYLSSICPLFNSPLLIEEPKQAFLPITRTNFNYKNSPREKYALMEPLWSISSAASLRFGSSAMTMAETMSPQYCGQAIGHLHDCLGELTLLDDNYSMGGESEDSRAIGSLVEFTELREIVTHATTLLGLGLEDEGEASKQEDGALQSTIKPRLVDILPACLQKLVLWNCGPGMFNQILELLAQRKKLPRLVYVSIGFQRLKMKDGKPVGMDTSTQEQLVTDYAAVRVKLQLLHWGRPNAR